MGRKSKYAATVTVLLLEMSGHHLSFRLTDVHVDELRTFHTEEVNIAFCCHCFCHQRFPSTWLQETHRACQVQACRPYIHCNVQSKACLNNVRSQSGDCKWKVSAGCLAQCSFWSALKSFCMYCCKSFCVSPLYVTPHAFLLFYSRINYISFPFVVRVLMIVLKGCSLCLCQ